MERILEYSNPKHQELVLTIIMGVYLPSRRVDFIFPYQTVFYRGELNLYSTDITSLSTVLLGLYDRVWVEPGVLCMVHHSYNEIILKTLRERDWFLVETPKSGLAVGKLYGVPEPFLRNREIKFKIVEIQKVILNKQHKDVMRLKERLHSLAYTQIDDITSDPVQPLKNHGANEDNYIEEDRKTKNAIRKQKSKSMMQNAKLEKKRDKLTRKLSTVEEKTKATAN